MAKSLFVLAAIILLVLVGCNGDVSVDNGNQPDMDAPVSSDDPSWEPAPTINYDDTERVAADVKEMEILILESFPLQINVSITGEYNSGCAWIETRVTQSDENTFNILVEELFYVTVECEAQVVEYFENVSLDVYGLPAGTYTVIVNDMLQDTFTFQQDNAPLVDDPDAGNVTYDYGLAYVDAVDIDVINGLLLTIQGSLADGCTELDQISHTVVGDVIQVEVITRRNTALMCTEALVPFETDYAVLPSPESGTYTLRVNDFETSIQIP